MWREALSRRQQSDRKWKIKFHLQPPPKWELGQSDTISSWTLDPLSTYSTEQRKEQNIPSRLTGSSWLCCPHVCVHRSLAGSTAPVLKPWVTFPGQLCPVAYTRQERPKLWQRHQRMKGLKKCQSGRHHKSMFKQGTPEVQRWRRTHCILLKEELQLAHRIGK